MQSLGKNIQSVQRAIDILNCFSRDNAELSLSQISEALELNKSTVHGIVNTLRNNGYLQQSTTGKYLLGPALLSKYSFSDTSERTLFRNAAQDKMELLVNRYKSPSSIFIFTSTHPYSVHHVAPINAKYYITSEFDKTELYCSASGKLALSLLSEEELETYLDRHPLEPCSVFTIQSVEELKKALATIREQGYSEENQESSEGISSISVPVYFQNRVFGSFSISNTCYVINQNRESIIADLKKYSAKITASLEEI